MAWLLTMECTLQPLTEVSAMLNPHRLCKFISFIANQGGGINQQIHYINQGQGFWR